MTIRLDMCKAVANAREALGDSAEAVRGLLQRRLASEGGFQGRDGRSDLYYTVFGLEASLMLGFDFPRERVTAYLDSFGQGESLDLVHLAALIRCRANLGSVRNPETLAQRLMTYRSRDGGFNMIPGEAQGSAYGSFLTLGVWQDLGIECPDIEAVAQSIASLQRSGGGYANEASMTAGATPATAAAICTLHSLKRPIPESAIQWLLARVHPLGGFVAIPMIGDLGTPDLLSTATALHALSLLGVCAEDARDKHLDYLDSLWSAEGGFRGHWADDVVDCEYTYYGLLALGILTA
ncbi:MAG TPA: prenyltransferase/squalene oxidase repeat-containing protein [Sedimentisphaerales bacterium]|nr:prenyltransferase/squalene oxidase repeat-containing protein [Sedimentisphaerales bacterium]